ncbi:endolytic transglycosylase MltG [Microbacterium suwonense]|uniref:Endolytic murein transglycosylase n=1 Tax=Microbacterium suwonense TaxID=683047 RepID=A0ABN6X2Q5_9MICO|nr:endolytic transglycosylase MltG [Microbacterium suwonense]BDZ38252.1 hypothetical protein GCM10025863_08660 [Microbacterium suwonense]
MPDPDESSPSSGLGDLFDHLPAAASSPHRAPESGDRPAPGSRRARREAQQQQPDAARASTTPDAAADGPDPSQPSPAEPGAPEIAAQNPVEESPLDAIFAPERHVRVPKRKRGRGCLIGLIIVLVVLGGMAAGGAWVYNTYQDKINDMMGWGEPKDYEPGQATGEALVTIKKGDTGSPVSTALFQAGVTKTDRVFYEYLLKENPGATFYPGVYKLQKKMTAAAALEALGDPETRMENTVRIAEGGTVASSLPRIVDGVGIPLDELEAAVADPAAYRVQAKSLEGWLFPAVYTFDPGVTADEVIQRMVDRTREALKKVGVPDADAQRVLTIASIIEREARTPDFTKVSRVIENRLDIGMKLEMDSTSQYGAGELHAGSSNTSENAQRQENDWNTYAIEGLPATPIANSSEAAIDAAMHPADGPWLFFVTVDPDNGTTIFSTTLQEHNNAIKKLGEWCRANGNPAYACKQ